MLTRLVLGLAVLLPLSLQSQSNVIVQLEQEGSSANANPVFKAKTTQPATIGSYTLPAGTGVLLAMKRTPGGGAYPALIAANLDGKALAFLPARVDVMDSNGNPVSQFAQRGILMKMVHGRDLIMPVGTYLRFNNVTLDPALTAKAQQAADAATAPTNTSSTQTSVSSANNRDKKTADNLQYDLHDCIRQPSSGKFCSLTDCPTQETVCQLSATNLESSPSLLYFCGGAAQGIDDGGATSQGHAEFIGGSEFYGSAPHVVLQGNETREIVLRFTHVAQEARNFRQISLCGKRVRGTPEHTLVNLGPTMIGGIPATIQNGSGRLVEPKEGAPRTVPQDEHDPTGFDVLGVKLYMSGAEVIKALNKHSKEPWNELCDNRPADSKEAATAKAQAGFKYRQTHKCPIHVYLNYVETITIPGQKQPVEITSRAISEISYQFDGNSISIRFTPDTLSHAFGKPEIATDILYTAASLPTAADVTRFFDAMLAKYGKPRSAVYVYGLRRGSTTSRSVLGSAEPPPPPTDPNMTPAKTYMLWFPDSGERITSYSTRAFEISSSIAAYYPVMGVTRPPAGSGINERNKLIFELVASSRFSRQVNKELDEKKKQLIEEANKKTTGVHPQF